MNRHFALISLLIAGLGWGTTGLFVRVLGTRGFSSFELLALRLIVVFAVLSIVMLPRILTRLKNKDFFEARRSTFFTAIFVSGLMLFYYLGAIVAVQNLPLVFAVLVIGSSPLISWGVPLLFEFRRPKGEEWTQGLGVLFGILGLLGLALSKNDSSVVPANSVPLLGYAGGFVAAIVTVVNARKLRSVRSDQLPSPQGISFLTATFGLLLSPLLFFESEQLFSRVEASWVLILGFGILATLIPGFAIAYASSRLSPTTTSTVSIQLQVWTAVLGWIILDEKLSLIQSVSAASVVLGTTICVFWRAENIKNVSREVT
ncbi:MAG: DMT family transporter [Bdellovibrionales bacterium]|nr:DMT family transporter [Bdellovibrionales bacterium]